MTLQSGTEFLTNYFITAYVTSWDAPSQFLVKNLDGFRHKVIDIDENPDIADQQKIKATPTIQIYNEAGELVATKIGAVTKSIIEEWIKDYA
jgi:thioredoxin-like negative regulator of GroEL